MKSDMAIGFDDLLRGLGPASLLFNILRAFGAGVGTAVGVSTALLVLALLWVGVARLWARQGTFEVVEDDGGNLALEAVRDATRSVIVTHFGSEVPSPEYRETLHRKIKEGVRVERILPAESTRPQWITPFDALRNEGGGYRERRVPTRLPFDILVVDGHRVQILLPPHSSTNEFNTSLSFDDERIAQLLLSTVLNLGQKGHLSAFERMEPAKAFAYIRERVGRCTAMRNTAFGSEGVLAAPHYTTWLDAIVEAVTKRDCRIHEIAPSDRRSAAITERLRDKPQLGTYTCAALSRGGSAPPQVEFVVLDYPDAPSEVIFGWGHAGGHLNADCFRSEDERVVHYFRSQFDELSRSAAQELPARTGSAPSLPPIPRPPS